MNQKWFNGVGAYIRSELLYKTNINPFQPANQLSISILNELTHTLHLLFRESYQLGGGTNKELHNTNMSAASFNEWFKCYGNKNMLKIVDKKGRNLWFNPIWKHQSDEYLK
jgi:endonuclease VIII-like 1